MLDLPMGTIALNYIKDSKILIDMLKEFNFLDALNLWATQDLSLRVLCPHGLENIWELKKKRI